MTENSSQQTHHAHAGQPAPAGAQVPDARRIDPALRAKYDVRGPRYTSYPPATEFAEIAAEPVLASWRGRNELPSDPGLSLYFHIPFCRTRCLFCACNAIAGGGPERSAAYVECLLTEMQLAGAVVDPARVVRQVALGGGTPNFLPPEQLDRLLDALKRSWRVAPDAELSVEIDPRTATPQALAAFLRHGFNRFSLGIQDFADEVIAPLRRGHDQMAVAEVVDQLRAAGCAEINFDLIYGLPGQSVETAQRTAARVTELMPTRIALYSYAHVPWLHRHQEALARLGLPEQDLKAEIFFAMADHFRAHDYHAIGMDHFARPGDRLFRALQNRNLRRNFMGYTTGRGLDILGFGVSAISSVGRAYSQNEKDLAAYTRQIEAQTLPISRGLILSADDEIRRELLLDLFCNFYVDLERISETLDIDAPAYFRDDIERLQPFVDDGLLRLDGTAIDVTPLGRFFIRTICMTFDRYLKAHEGKRVFSRTV